MYQYVILELLSLTGISQSISTAVLNIQSYQNITESNYKKAVTLNTSLKAHKFLYNEDNCILCRTISTHLICKYIHNYCIHL